MPRHACASPSFRSGQGNALAANSVYRFLCSLVVLVCLCVTGAAQENYLVSTQDGVLSLYDLATNSLIQTMKGSPPGQSLLLPGANNRVAFDVTSDYVTVADQTIGREIARIKDTGGVTGAKTPDGKFLLVPDANNWLDFIDTASLQIVRKVSLRTVLGNNQTGSIVIAHNKAFVFPLFGQQARVAVVNLSTYEVSSIQIPAGYFDTSNVAAVTPDGSTIAAVEFPTTVSELLLLIDTATNTLVSSNRTADIYYTSGLVINPSGADPNKIFGYAIVADDVGWEIAVLDLSPGSKTYGSFLTGSRVSFPLFQPYALAINSDGTRLIVGGQNIASVQPNTFVIDAQKAVSDPSNAIVAQLSVNNGVDVYAVTTGFFSTIPPNTAPVVTGVSGDISNDAAHQIEITGGNFQQGAMVRIGSMDRLPANVTGGGTLTVTVPANAPAGKALDIVVTNPGAQAPPEQQNQSGVLAGRFNILLNPKFQSATQFATVNNDGSFSAYDLSQRSMINVQMAQSDVTPLMPAFNVDGRGLYLSSFTSVYNNLLWSVVPVDLSNNKPGDPIILPGGFQLSHRPLAGSVDPLTGKPVVNVAWRNGRLYLGVIDSDSKSPTFNTVIRSFDSGHNIGALIVENLAVTPDGKFAYVWYRSAPPRAYFVGIFDLTTGAFTSINAQRLGLFGFPDLVGVKISITPDGKSMLMTTNSGNKSKVEVLDISQPMAPKPIAQLSPAPISGYPKPNIQNYYVVGDQLYAFDASGVIYIFNFRKANADYRLRGWYIYPNLLHGFDFNVAFSPDGAWLYVADPVNDLISVLDPTKLLSGKDAVVTNLRAPYYPKTLAVSPTPPPFARQLKTPPIEPSRTEAPSADPIVQQPKAPSAKKRATSDQASAQHPSASSGTNMSRQYRGR